MEYFAGQDPRSYSLYFDLNTWFRARKVTETFEKRVPGIIFQCNYITTMLEPLPRMCSSDAVWCVFWPLSVWN